MAAIIQDHHEQKGLLPSFVIKAVQGVDRGVSPWLAQVIRQIGVRLPLLKSGFEQVYLPADVKALVDEIALDEVENAAKRVRQVRLILEQNPQWLDPNYNGASYHNKSLLFSALSILKDTVVNRDLPLAARYELAKLAESVAKLGSKDSPSLESAFNLAHVLGHKRKEGEAPYVTSAIVELFRHSQSTCVSSTYVSGSVIGPHGQFAQTNDKPWDDVMNFGSRATLAENLSDVIVVVAAAMAQANAAKTNLDRNYEFNGQEAFEYLSGLIQGNSNILGIRAPSAFDVEAYANVASDQNVMGAITSSSETLVKYTAKAVIDDLISLAARTQDEKVRNKIPAAITSIVGKRPGLMKPALEALSAQFSKHYAAATNYKKDSFKVPTAQQNLRMANCFLGIMVELVDQNINALDERAIANYTTRWLNRQAQIHHDLETIVTVYYEPKNASVKEVARRLKDFNELHLLCNGMENLNKTALSGLKGIGKKLPLEKYSELVGSLGLVMDRLIEIEAKKVLLGPPDPIYVQNKKSYEVFQDIFTLGKRHPLLANKALNWFEDKYEHADVKGGNLYRAVSEWALPDGGMSTEEAVVLKTLFGLFKAQPHKFHQFDKFLSIHICQAKSNPADIIKAANDVLMEAYSCSSNIGESGKIYDAVVDVAKWFTAIENGDSNYAREMNCLAGNYMRLARANSMISKNGDTTADHAAKNFVRVLQRPALNSVIEEPKRKKLVENYADLALMEPKNEGRVGLVVQGLGGLCFDLKISDVALDGLFKIGKKVPGIGTKVDAELDKFHEYLSENNVEGGVALIDKILAYEKRHSLAAFRYHQSGQKTK